VEGIPFLSTDNAAIGLAIVALAILGVALFSSAEAALISAKEVRLRRLAEEGSIGAKAALGLRAQHDKLFAAVLLSEDLLTVFASSFGTALALHFLGESGVLFATIALTVVAVIFGALAPKTFATSNAERWSTLIARPIELVVWLETPLIYVFTFVSNGVIRLLGGHRRHKSPFVTEEEIRILIDIGEQEGTVDEAEKEMIENVFTFSERQVREIMTPRTEIVALSKDATLGEALDLFADHGFHRIPAYEGSIDNITGLIEARDLLVWAARGELDRARPIADLVEPVHVVPETKPLSTLLPEMQHHRAALAIVIDEYGGTAGMVTMEQVIEEIVGDIQDPHDGEDAEVQAIDEDTYLIDAGMRIDEANDQLGLELPEGDYDTVAGFVLAALGHIPESGEELEHSGKRIIVSEMDGLKIEKLLIKRSLAAA
jgi:CBS domain containing-hemolysin-like protein